jgi:hypothetical protein
VTASFAGVETHSPWAIRVRVIPWSTSGGERRITFLAARHVGPAGLVLAVDMTPAMLELGRQHVALTGLKQSSMRRPGRNPSAPGRDRRPRDLQWCDQPGPRQDRVFRESARVLKPAAVCRLRCRGASGHPARRAEDVTIWTARIEGLSWRRVPREDRPGGIPGRGGGLAGLRVCRGHWSAQGRQYEAVGVKYPARKP